MTAIKVNRTETDIIINIPKKAIKSDMIMSLLNRLSVENAIEISFEK